MGQCCSAPSAHEGAAAAPAAAPQAFRAAGGAPAAAGLERALSVSSVDFGDARTHFSASVDLGGVLPGAHAAAADDVEGGLAMECRPSHAGGLYAEQLLAAGGLTAEEEVRRRVTRGWEARGARSGTAPRGSDTPCFAEALAGAFVCASSHART